MQLNSDRVDCKVQCQRGRTKLVREVLYQVDWVGGSAAQRTVHQVQPNCKLNQQQFHSYLEWLQLILSGELHWIIKLIGLKNWVVSWGMQLNTDQFRSAPQLNIGIAGLMWEQQYSIDWGIQPAIFIVQRILQQHNQLDE